MMPYLRQTARRLAGATLLAVFAALAPAVAVAQASTEMIAGTNDVSTTTPSLGPVAVTLQNNSDNPAGTTFAAIAAPTPTASITVSNLQYANSTNFSTQGVFIGSASAAGPRFALMSAIGSATDTMYTSLPVVTAGTGMAVATNRGWYIESRTQGPSAAGAAQTGRLHVADLTIDLSVPMSNVVLHIVGWGGTSGSKTFTTEFDLLTASSVGATGLTRLSGNSVLAVSGTQVTHSGSTVAASCSATPSAACGSIQVTGTGITRIVLRTYIRSSEAVAWSTTGADAFVLGLSGEVADLTPTLGAIPATIQPGETYYGLTATCTNNGPNTARGGLCSFGATSGTVSGLTCTGFTAGALATGATVTCTYDYTAPLSGSGVGSTVLTATTGASNDRNGGTTTGGNNVTTASRTLSDTPFSPATPSGICSAVADRMTFSFTGVAGGTEAGSYDLISRSPFSYNTSGKPVFMTGSGTVSTQTIATTPGVLFQPTELVTTTLPTTATTGTGEIVIITSRVVGRSGSAMTVRVSDSGQADHDVFTIETAVGAMLARTPASGSNNTDGDLLLSFTMPADGFVFLRQYIADYGDSYGQRLDGGCLRTNLVTVKSRTSATSVEVGQTATFSITVTNSGPSDASNIRLTDLMPATLSGVTAVPSAGSYNVSTGLWTLNALANGASATLTLSGTATAAATNSTVTNTTTAAQGDQTDPTTASDVLSASVTVLQAPQVTATKTVVLLSNQATSCATRSSTPDAGVQAFLPGSCVEYVIGLSNPTTSPARDIRMTDVLAARLAFMGATASGFDTSDPAYALTAPSAGTLCGGTACSVRLDKARLAANTSGQVRIRAVLQ